eukprot:1273415-Rhodomonas_salina.3
MFDPDVSKVCEATMLKEMADTVEHRDYGRVLTRLSVVWSRAIRKTFTTADPKAFVKAAQKSEAPMDTAMEDEMQAAQVLFVNTIWGAVFGPKGTKARADYGRREILLAIIQTQAVKDICDSKTPKGIEKWEEWLWMMTAV